MQDQQAMNYGKYLPIANISRIMKKALPQNAKIAKQAKQTVQQCVSQFISFITSQACQKCKGQKRKTINGQDMLYAITTLGLQSYADILKMYLSKYRQSIKGHGKEKNQQQDQDRQRDKQEQEHLQLKQQ